MSEMKERNIRVPVVDEKTHFIMAMKMLQKMKSDL